MQQLDLLEVNFLTKKVLQKSLRQALPEDQYWRIRYRMVLQSTVCGIVTVAAAAMLASMLWFPILQVYGNSMSPTLRTGDVLLCVKTGNISQGDITAFYHNNKLLIKRIIGKGGDRVEISTDGTVSINDLSVTEPYIVEPDMGQVDISLPCQVPAGCYFVLGDCRATSLDSRSESVGCVPQERILGKVLLRIWPLSRFGTVP
jgi:signal peptidase I